MSQTLKEAASAVLNKKAFPSGNAGKGVKADGEPMEKEPTGPTGATQDLGAAVVEPDAATGPGKEAGKKQPKVKAKKIEDGADKADAGDDDSAKKLKKLVKGQEGAVTEDEEFEDEDYLYLGEEDEDDKDEDDEDDEDEDDEDEDDEVNEGIELPSIYDLDIDLSEDVAAIFSGQDLSEEFMEKTAFVFESAVRTKVNEYGEQLAEMFENTLLEAAEAIKEDMENDVDKYLSYVVEEWVSDNEVAIESGLRTELAEDVLSGIRDVFVEHYIDIPEDKVDVVEALSQQVNALETELNEAIETNSGLYSLVKESEKERVNTILTDGLTETQAEKILTLAEGVEFDNSEDYADKVGTLVESYFPKSGAKKARLLDEEIVNDPDSNVVEENTPLPGNMSKYVAAIGKTRTF